MKTKLFSILGGIAATAASIAVFQSISQANYPPPPDLGFANKLMTEIYLANIPTGAFLLAFAGMAVGGLANGFVASLIDTANGKRNALVVALLFTIFGVTGMLAVEHPLKFWIINIVTYIPFAVAGSRLAKKYRG